MYLIFGLNFSGVEAYYSEGWNLAGLSVNGSEAKLFLTEAEALKIATELNRTGTKQGWYFATLPASAAANSNQLG